MSGDDLGLEMIARSASAVLGPGVSVAVVVEPGGAGTSGEGRGETTALVTLEAGAGSTRRASRRLRLTPGRRSLLLSLSACLAECAMDLGLGASVCRGARRPRAALRRRRSETP